VDGVTVFNSVKEAVEAVGASASFVVVPPKFASNAIIEAAEGGIRSSCVSPKASPPTRGRTITSSRSFRACDCSGQTVPAIIMR